MSQSISFPNNSISYLTPSWADLDRVCLQLAEHIRSSGKQFDRLITLAKGGWPMSRSLVDFLQIPEVASIGIKFYAGINQTMESPVIYQDLPIVVKGERVLLFDDVADSGKSLVFTKEHLLNQGVTTVSTATLYYKPVSVLKPDFFGEETTSWIIFPFEIMESLDQVARDWQKNGKVADEELKIGFQKLGLGVEQIDYYFKWYRPNC